MKNWTFVDRKPRAASDGFALPTATPQLPNYAAASMGRRLRIWRVPQSGPNFSVARDIPLIRGRSRAAARNDPWMGAGLEKLDANGIATGIQAKMINGTPELKASVKALHAIWAKECDADGVLSETAQQLLAWHEWNEAGEVFARLRPRRLSDGLAVPLQVQVIESEQVPTDLYQTASNGNEIRAGIEIDKIGRRVAYWMYREHPGEYGFYRGGSELTRVPASEVIHLYRPMRAGQLRGIVDHASVLIRMFNLDNMDDAVLERQKMANMFAGFFETAVDPEEPPESMVDDMTRDGDGEQESDYDDTPLAGLEPGTMQELPPGMQAKFSQPPAPGADYTEYLRSHLLAIAARIGVPYEVLTGDLRNVSDRALRLLLNEFRRTIEMRQWLFFIPQWCQRIREAFFDYAYMAGALELPDYVAKRAEYVETLWVPEGWPYSHPVQDVTADIKAIRAGLGSRSRVLLRNGEDPEEVDRQNAEDNARADDHGLVYDTDGRKTSSAGLTQARPAGTVNPPTGAPQKEKPNDQEEDDDDGEAQPI